VQERRGLKRNKIKESIMKVVILGCGRVGAKLAELLEAEGHEVCIIDRERSAFNRLEHFKGKRLLGNGIDVDLLKKAGIESADAFAAVTNGDNTNIMSAQIAQKIFNVPKVVCRVNDPRRAGIYYDLGLQTVCSTTVGARMVRNILSDPTVLRRYHLGDGTAEAIEVKIGKSAVGKTVQELEIPEAFSISAVVRNGVPFVPKKSERLKENDQIFGVVLSSYMDEVKKLLDSMTFAVNYT
jgi:trk system potassium uptake protein TrkA